MKSDLPLIKNKTSILQPSTKISKTEETDSFDSLNLPTTWKATGSSP